MHKIITLAAAASLLTLAACNRDAETAPAVDDAAATSADAMAADSAGMDASTSASGSSGSGSTAAPAAGSGSETMAPAPAAGATPTGTSMGPVTDQTRANAQMAAEETNLHPKPSGQH